MSAGGRVRVRAGECECGQVRVRERATSASEWLQVDGYGERGAGACFGLGATGQAECGGGESVRTGGAMGAGGESCGRCGLWAVARVLRIGQGGAEGEGLKGRARAAAARRHAAGPEGTLVGGDGPEVSGAAAGGCGRAPESAGATRVSGFSGGDVRCEVVRAARDAKCKCGLWTAREPKGCEIGSTHEYEYSTAVVLMS